MYVTFLGDFRKEFYMTTKQEQAEKTKQDLLDAALVVFSKKGYSTTRLEDIAKQAGVTRGAFYWHFKNKSDVFSELHEQVMREFISDMKNTHDNTLPSLNNLRNALYYTTSRILNDERSKRCGKLFYRDEHAPELLDELKKLKKKTEQSVYAFFSEIIEKGKKVKEIRDDISTRQIYISLIITLKGSIMQIFDSLSPLSEEDIESAIDIQIDGLKNIRN
jgi:AcrR family transcriptional regulator